MGNIHSTRVQTETMVECIIILAVVVVLEALLHIQHQTRSNATSRSSLISKRKQAN